MFGKIKFFIVSLLLLLLFLGFFHPIYSITQDLGRHLLVGEIILKTHDVPKINLFSYTHPAFPFVNHHWLSEVVFFLIFNAFGFNGLLILSVLLVLSSFSLILSLAFKKTNPFWILTVSLLLFPILFERTDVRPELFSFLFFCLFIVILYRFREKFTKLIFLLPFIELLWVNIHIYFPVGIILVAFFAIDSIFKHKSFNLRYTGISLIVLTGCVLVTFLNPNGLKGALYPLSVFQNYGYSIEENQNVFLLWNFFHKQSILFFFITVPLLFLSFLLNFKRVLIVDWLISIIFAILAFISIRNFPLFVFATFIPFVKSLSGLKLLTLNKQFKFIIVILLLCLYFFVAQQAYVNKGFGFGLEKGAKDAVDFFTKENLKGPIFNNFDIGSYLEYRLYPKEKVFVDGRPEAYPSDFFQKTYIPMQEDPAIFSQMDKKYHFQTIFFSHADQTPWGALFLKNISNNKDWNLVYLDDVMVIWTKNQTIKPKIQTSYSNFQSLLRIAHFFQAVNFPDQEMKAYRDILNLNPTFCPALYNFWVLLSQRNDLTAPIYLSKFQHSCR